MNNGEVLITTELPSVPVFLSVFGSYITQYRIIVACRDGKIYTIKDGKVAKNPIILQSHCCGMVLVRKLLMVGCIDSTISCYTGKGQRLWILTMPSPIVGMILLNYRPKMFLATVVALKNGEVRTYVEKMLIDTFTLSGYATSMAFGEYMTHNMRPSGKVVSVLACVTSRGTIVFKRMQLDDIHLAGHSGRGVISEQSIKVNIPTKTQLYMNQVLREQENSIAMHRALQRDLARVRLTTLREYVKILVNKMTTLVNTVTVSVKMNGQVRGLGPLFKLTMAIQNASPEPLCDLRLFFFGNETMYRIIPPVVSLRLLLPGLLQEYCVSIKVDIFLI